MVPEVLSAGRELGLVSRWFFVRYADPQEHLRIRFQGDPGKLARELWPLASAILRPLLDSGKIWRIQLDTYEREVERYGGLEPTSLAEEIFAADSDAAVAILQATPGDEGLDHRWRTTLVGIDRLLENCGLDLRTRRATVERLRDSFHREFHVGPSTKKQLGELFRRERRRLEEMFESSPRPESIGDTARQAFVTRSARIAEVVRELRSLEDAGKLAVSIPELADSYVHMHVNRMIRSGQRAHEAVLYDLLFRIYDGRLAKNGRTNAFVNLNWPTLIL